MSRTLLLIVIAELFGSSVWFSTNGVAAQDSFLWHSSVGVLTNAVQYGFIVGTLSVALSGLADRFHASRIFAACAVGAAVSNIAFAWLSDSLLMAWSWRFATGLCLAGVYPLGMKLVVSWEPDKKGFALGWLTGMLAFGTASPHLVRALNANWPWQWVIAVSSVLALVAAGMVFMVGDGPHQKATGRLDWGGVLKAFHRPDFKAAACGYFGHMWELYAFWTMVPLLLMSLFSADGEASQLLSTASQRSYWSFMLIGAGGAGCILGGYASRRWGSGSIAFGSLVVSGLCCALYPLLMPVLGTMALLLILLLWGITVVSDSPQFSALASHFAPADSVGSALAVMNGIGFFITTLSIQLSTSLWAGWHEQVLWLLLPGPLLGLLGMRRLVFQRL